MKCHKCLVARPQGPKQQDHLAWLEKALLKCKVHNGCVSVRVGGLNGGQIIRREILLDLKLAFAKHKLMNST